MQAVSVVLARLDTLHPCLDHIQRHGGVHGYDTGKSSSYKGSSCANFPATGCLRYMVPDCGVASEPNHAISCLPSCRWDPSLKEPPNPTFSRNDHGTMYKSCTQLLWLEVWDSVIRPRFAGQPSSHLLFLEGPRRHLTQQYGTVQINLFSVTTASITGDRSGD